MIDIAKILKVFLVAFILAVTVVTQPGVMYAEEDSGDTGSATPVEDGGEEDDDETKPDLTGNVGMDTNTADTVKSEVKKALIEYGGNGGAISAKFEQEGSKDDHTKLFNEIVSTQIKLYELLYVTGVHSALETPVNRADLGESGDLDNLEDYLIAYNVINSYLDIQIESLESEEEHDEHLVEALKKLKFDMKPFKDKSITPEKPMSINIIRSTIKGNIDSNTSNAIGLFLKYLNDGKGSDDTKVLEKADTVESTKKVIGLIKQWVDLPHIDGAEDSMKLPSLEDNNQEWLTALEGLISTMETDTGGVTNKDQALANGDTNPELATSVLGRLGSSLFTVKRSAHADDTPNKPLTNTLAWVIEEDLRKSPEEYDPGPAAKDDFLAMFAATSVYVPFVSKVGDKDYVEAFKALFNDVPEPIGDDNELVVFPESPLGPLDILSQVQNLRKPLYFYKDLDPKGGNSLFGHSTQDVKGPAELLTVGQLIQAVEKKQQISAITMHGVMEKDSDTWAFYNYSLNKDGVAGTGGGGGSTTTTKTIVETNEDGEEVEVEESSSFSGSSGVVDSNVAAGMPILNKVPAEKIVNGGQDSTRVVFEMSFNEKRPGVGLLTGALMHNIYEDTLLKSKIKERMNEAVYLDAVGNIILNDGLVVLPASANPLYWAIPATEKLDEDGDINSFDYNPFTVAFMDTYPAIYQGGSSPSTVNEKKDKNKYILTGFRQGGRSVIVSPIKKGFKSVFAVSNTAHLVRTFKVDGSDSPPEDQVQALKGEIGVDDKDTVASKKWFNVIGAHPFQMKNISTENGNNLFPYLTTKIVDPFGQQAFDRDDIDYTSSILIAKNMYSYILGEDEEAGSVTAASGVSEGGSSSGRLREGFLFNNVTMPALTGITNGIEFDKTNARSDLLKVGGDSGVIQKWVLNFSKWLATTVTHSTNILAISNADEVSVLKFIYGVFIEFGYYIVFLLIIILILIFLKEGDFISAAVKGGVITTLLFSSLFLIPLLIPWVTGMTANPLTKTTVLNSLLSKMELVDKVYEQDAPGQSGLSVKLYNMSPNQAKDINDQHQQDGNYLTNKFSINDNLGLFIKGTELRLDLYSFWRFDPLIIATADDVANPNEEVNGSIPQIYHSDHSTSEFMASNEQAKTEMGYNRDLVDYYMPYNMLEDGLIKTLNTYLVYYNPPQSVVRYPDGLVKSSYVINTFMKSLAFLAGEPSIGETIASATNEEEYAHLGLNAAEVEIVNQKFYPYGDILGLQKWVESELSDLTNTQANSIWTQTMIKSGYYSPGTGIDKRLALADKVNRKVYDTILEMAETKGAVSDETLIKMIALTATMEWNKEISFMSNNVFPKTFALNEISASDILASTVLGQSSQFLFYDISVIENVYATNGLVGVIVIDIAFIMLAIYSIILSWLLPIIVIGMVTYSVYLVLTNRSVMPVMIFVAKLIFLAVVMNFVLMVIINMYQLYNSIYVLTLLLTATNALFLWLFWRMFFRKKDKDEGTWQHKHLKQMGIDINQQSTEQASMQEYLKESEGVYGRRSSGADRYYG